MSEPQAPEQSASEKQPEARATAPSAAGAGKLTERQFCQLWIHTLSLAMMKSGRGFRMDSPRRVPPQGAAQWRGERRADKEGTTKLSRRLLQGAK